MYSTVDPVREQAPAATAAAGRTGATTTLVTALCIGTILFLAAATIVLSLIPVYLPKKTLSIIPSSNMKYIRLNPSPNVPPNGQTSSTACYAIATSMNSAFHFPSGTIIPISCTFALPGSRRRRQSRILIRYRRQTDSKLYMVVDINRAKCASCGQLGNLNKKVGTSFQSSFDFYGPLTENFNVESISSQRFASFNTIPIQGSTPLASTTPTPAPAVTSDSLIG
ncbi:unnamed protein product [Rotaria sp. Silwood1]|nr:unnamed protein product [Rotaria sp. Silwood1]